MPDALYTGWCSYVPTVPAGPPNCPEDKPCLEPECSRRAGQTYLDTMWNATNAACTAYQFAREDRANQLNSCIQEHERCINAGLPNATCDASKTECDASAEASFQATVATISADWNTAKNNATVQYWTDLEKCCMECPDEGIIH